MIHLNNKQQYAFDLMVNKSNVFITGPGGVGKSELIRQYKAHYISTHKKWWETLGITSTTGCASLLLGGRTLHSFLGIGLGKGSTDELIANMKANHFKTWRTLNVLIIDEISMLSPELFDKLEHIGRILRKSDLPFGGIQIILSGDFCQLPIIGNDNIFCFDAKSWSTVIHPKHIVYLDEIIRQRDQIFQKALNEIRLGILTPETKQLLTDYTRPCPPDQLILPTRICATNHEVDLINMREFNHLINQPLPPNQSSSNQPPKRKQYTFDMVVTTCPNSTPYECQTIVKNMTCDAVLQLTIGAQVMLLVNMLDKNLANGSRGVVVDFDSKGFPLVQFDHSQVELITTHRWDFEAYNKKICYIDQIPLKLAWAITTHKSQGMSIDVVEIDMNRAFVAGQIYVALSRVRSLDGLYITNINYDKIQCKPRVIDFYKSIT